MVDPTSNLNEDVSPDDAPNCRSCNATLVDSANHRVVTWIEDGAVEAAHFCDDGCRSEWDGES